MTHKIFTSNDRAIEEHDADPMRRPYKTHRERMLFDFNTVASSQLRGSIAVWNGEEGNDKPITAVVNGGRWVARCECGGQENVEPTDPIFFCHECGNKDVGGKSRPVIFPSESKRNQIEKDLLQIPVDYLAMERFMPPSQKSAAFTRRNWEGE